MRVLFLDTVHEILEQRLTKAGFDCIHLESASEEVIREQMVDCEGIVIRSRFPMNSSWLDRCKQLKFIARSGAGMENIDEEYCSKRGFKLYNAPEGNRNAVGEHSLALLLNLMNLINAGDKDIRAGQWNREGHRGEELDGKTIGIIGYGNNGRAFAKKLQGFNVNILVNDLIRIDPTFKNVEQVELSAIQEKADVLSFHIPQNAETIGFFDTTLLKNMKKPFYLLNVARGKIVNLETVEEGLNSGQIKGVGLDVFEFESSSFENGISSEIPLKYPVLFNHPRVIMSPHVAGWTKESYFKLSDVLADKILADF